LGALSGGGERLDCVSTGALPDDEITLEVNAPLDTADWLEEAGIAVFDVTGDESLTVACDKAEEEYSKLLIARWPPKITTAAILAAVTRVCNFIVTLYMQYMQT